MSFESFMKRVNAVVDKSNEGFVGNDRIRVDFSIDEENGKFVARCSDGTVILGNSLTVKMTVVFGSGHCGMA